VIVIPQVPRPRPHAVERAKIELDRALGPSKVLTDREACTSYARDDSGAEAMPDVVALATTAEDVRRTLEIAERTGVPVVPRAAGTGRTGGAVPVAGGIVLATHAMKRVLEIDNKNLVAVVEPGIVTGELHALVENEGLFYPPDPNSLDSCQIGGNVAENAGGPRALKYGVTRDWVLGLEVGLVGGRMLQTGRRTTKGVTGYDVTALLVGSEGTLGVFTKVTLQLMPKPVEIATILALYTDVRAAGTSVARVIGSGMVPRCMEMLDSITLGAVRAAGAAVDERAGALLLVEIDGDAIGANVERLGEIISGGEGVVDVLAAQDVAQRRKLWEARKMMSHATRRMAKNKLSEDVVVPRTRIAELLDRVDGIGRVENVRHATYGHAGDGNLHVNFFWDDPSEEPRVERAIASLMRATIDLGGTLSGEHGIGLAKAPYLAFEQSDDLIALQQDIKRVFDPNNLLNPGKIFPSRGHRAC
jgi:glycolate oxidase